MTTLDWEPSIQASLLYLDSDEALRSIEAHAYWPKWNSPWWHMTLLNEMGLAKRIPKRAVLAMTGALQTSPIQVFPIPPFETPPGIDVALASHCHCALGNIYQALSAAGVAVDRELPWIRPWFLRYQLSDGGLNCDENAYLLTPPPSSMVGTIAALEAVLLHGSNPLTVEEATFLNRGAECLLERELLHATSNGHNAEEMEDEEDWLKPCFPRFYLYDVLRGLSFVLNWSDRLNQKIKASKISKVIHFMEKRYPDNQIRLARHSYDGVGTRLKSSDWKKRGSADHFRLMDDVSQIGEISPFLTAQWNEARETLLELQNRGMIR